MLLELESRVVPAGLSLKWNGSKDTNWLLPANWTDTATGNPPMLAPQPADDVEIPAGVQFSPTIAVAGTANKVTVDAQAELDIGGTLQVSLTVTNSGTLDVQTGGSIVCPNGAVTNNDALYIDGVVTTTQVVNNSQVQGEGVVHGDFQNSGTLDVGMAHPPAGQLPPPGTTFTVDGDYTQMGANPEVLLHVGPAVCDKVEVTGTATLNPGQLVFFLNNFQGNAAVTYVPMIYNAHVGTFQNNPPTWTLGGVLYGAIYKNTELDLKSPPLAGTAPNINTVEGTNVTTVATFTDPAYATPPPPSNYTAVIDWGDGSASQGLVSGGGGSYSVGPASPHAYQKDGSYTTEVVITDNMAPTRTVTLSGSATITEAPLSSSGRPFSAVAGQPFAGVVASFTDGDSAAQPSDFQAMITWGDGTQSTPGVIQSSGGSSFNVTGAHTYASRGSYFFSVMISEVAGGMSTTATGMATVSAGALDEVLAALAAATQDQAAVPAQPSNPITPVSDALAADALFEQLTLAATT